MERAAQMDAGVMPGAPGLPFWAMPLMMAVVPASTFVEMTDEGVLPVVLDPRLRGDDVAGGRDA